ncbi:hypothetical protein ACQ4LK_24285, partial [Bacillus pumilus]
MGSGDVYKRQQLESQQQLIQQYEIDLGRYPLKAASISDELIEVEHSLSLLNEKEQQSYMQLPLSNTHLRGHETL